MTNLKGTLITLEGGDGAGKSSVLDFLYHELQSHGYPVVKTREPGGTALGDEVRKLLLQRTQGIQCGGRTELMLFLASRAQHVEELIMPALHAGKLVLCDRFNDSSIAYQGFARNFGMNEVEEMCKFVSQGIEPKLTLLFDLEPEKGLERVKRVAKQKSIGEMDRIESEAILFHEEVRCGYLLLAEKNPERIVILDASLPKEDVCARALQVVLSRIVQHA